VSLKPRSFLTRRICLQILMYTHLYRIYVYNFSLETKFSFYTTRLSSKIFLYITHVEFFFDSHLSLHSRFFFDTPFFFDTLIYFDKSFFFDTLKVKRDIDIKRENRIVFGRFTTGVKTNTTHASKKKNATIFLFRHDASCLTTH